MKPKIHYVLVKDFNLTTIRKAFSEGRLFIVPDPVEERMSADAAHHKGIQSILEYVQRIDHCASPSYQPLIQAIWHTILSHPELAPLFFFTRYQSSRGKVNWYRVNVFICLLREHDVYRSAQFTAVDLHCLCECANHYTAHYTGMSRYLLDRTHINIVREVLEKLS